MITDIENIHNISTLFRESRIYWHREFKIGFLNEVFVFSFDLLSVQISDQEIPMKYQRAIARDSFLRFFAWRGIIGCSALGL